MMEKFERRTKELNNLKNKINLAQLLVFTTTISLIILTKINFIPIIVTQVILISSIIFYYNKKSNKILKS